VPHACSTQIRPVSGHFVLLPGESVRHETRHAQWVRLQRISTRLRGSRAGFDWGGSLIGQRPQLPPEAQISSLSVRSRRTSEKARLLRRRHTQRVATRDFLDAWEVLQRGAVHDLELTIGKRPLQLASFAPWLREPCRLLFASSRGSRASPSDVLASQRRWAQS
jgi:hypothetical protein